MNKYKLYKVDIPAFTAVVEARNEEEAKLEAGEIYDDYQQNPEFGQFVVKELST